MRMTSKEAEVAWRADALPIALLFIDGDHEDTEADFLRWEPYVVPVGIIAIHDTTTWPSKVPYRTAIKYLYKSKWFWPVKRVGSITYAVKTNRYNASQKQMDTTRLVFRNLWQAIGIPCLNKTKYYAGKALGKL
jgi:predicted O-methyltransferase YrrM